MDQCLGQALAGIRGADPLAQLLEQRTVTRGDLGVNRVQERQRRQEVLTRAPLAVGIRAGFRPSRSTHRVVEGKRVEAAEQVGEQAELLGGVAAERHAVDEAGDEHRGAPEIRDRVVDREALRGEPVKLQKSEDRSITLGARPWTRRRKRTSHPRVAIHAVDAEHIGVVQAELRRGGCVDPVGLAEMAEQLVRRRLVRHPVSEALEIGQRLGVPLAGLRRVAPDDLLETAVSRHGTSPLVAPSSPSDAVSGDGLLMLATERANPLRQRNPGWGRRPKARRSVGAVAGNFADQRRACQAT